MGQSLECFWVALRLGLTSFGGPVAHLGFFQKEYVERRAWVSDATFRELLALSQLLPGPSSSQLGAAIGKERAGWAGLIAAWAGFTLPSALVMGLLGIYWRDFPENWLRSAGAGLAAVTLAVVGNATLQLGRTLCPCGVTRGVAVFSLVGMLLWSDPLMQMGVLVMGGVLGVMFLEGEGSTNTSEGVDNRVGPWWCCVVFLLLLGGSFFPFEHGFVQLMAVIYRAGALVFGGGHVVMPLLEAGVVEGGLLTPDTFSAGYGMTQAIPGPLFTFASFLGGAGGGGMGAVLGTVIVFLPGLLLLAAVLPRRGYIQKQAWAESAVKGASAAVVGLLATVVLGLLREGGAGQLWQLVLAAVSFVVLWRGLFPVWALVLAVVAGSVLLGSF